MVTAREPGASDVFTHGADASPRPAAALASRPARIMPWALAVLVHEVMAAIATAPSGNSADASLASVLRDRARKLSAISSLLLRRCGMPGPEMLRRMLARSTGTTRS